MKINIKNIINWMKTHEKYILDYGKNIPLEMHTFLKFNDSYNLIDKIKVMYVDEVPLPKSLNLYNQFKRNPRGLTLGNAVYIDKKYKNDLLLIGMTPIN